MSTAAQPTGSAETHAFQADVGKVLDLVIHSLYSQREIFLRELISNASDALDKLRYRALTDHDLATEGVPREIRITPDREAGTITIADTGIGMSHDELVEYLGTVAHSGTRAFEQSRAEAGAAADEVSLIGQFGVGFYSAYLVADRVDVVSRPAGKEGAAWRWSSDAREEYTLEPAERETHGTTVTLHLRDEEKGFAESWRIEDLVRRYSDYIDHPIRLVRPAEEAEEPEDGEAAAEAKEPEQINTGGALWKRPKDTITDEDYAAFYKHVTHDVTDPMARTHFTVEGTRMFTGLLFVPDKAPFDLFSQDPSHGVRLYVKRVFIMDECDALLPRWLRFIRGVIDSDDLPLNVSRETLQDSAVVRFIQKQVTRKALDMLDEIAADEERYAKFWAEFGLVLKEGVHLAFEHKERIGKLLRFRSSASDALTSLDAYVERMPEDQKAIYYVMAQSLDAAKSSPHLEALRKRGYEVLYLTDPIDEWVVMGLSMWGDHALVSAMKAGLELKPADEAEEKEREVAREAVSGVLERFQSVLGDRIGEVRASTRLTDSPVCLVVPEGSLHAHVERLLRQSDRAAALPETRRILEVNPTHPLITRLQELADAGKAETLDESIRLLYDQALLAEGSPVDDPAGFARRLLDVMTRSLA
ncbi:MAG: molecular chaperone HtpG [Deltaproteobacteria bacterium]|nr:molecular chaperone HtpG [Deltaproteobacteria bacterium]MCB9788809.1 molecular chaperone HtpG [Deltaproteobacteria bacterium]